MKYILFVLIFTLVCTTYANHPLKLRPRSMSGGNLNVGFLDVPEFNGSEIIGSYVTEEIFCSDETSFFCKDRKLCIDLLYECDNFSDCSDGSDEHELCSYFNCGDGYTLSSVFVCDDVKDCFNGHDEDEEHGNCTVVQCGNGSQTDQVTDTKICDGVFDCRDDLNSDECNCSFTFNCANRRCIHVDDRCNAVDDCGDGSDENNCNSFECMNGNHVPANQLCDGIDQCGDSTDECNCSDTNICFNNRCILKYQRCNGIDDCQDTSDECVCEHTFTCTNERCINDSMVGNGLDDCGDNSDEIFVTTASGANVIHTTAAAEDCSGDRKRKCGSGECISSHEICDGNVDCMDGMDENQCYTCRDKVTKIHLDFLCDGERDCPDGQDECNCEGRENYPIECPTMHGTTTMLELTMATKHKLTTATKHTLATVPTKTSGRKTTEQTAEESDRAPKSTAGCILFFLCWGTLVYLTLY